MLESTGHLVRRGLEATRELAEKGPKQASPLTIAAVAAMVITVLVFAVVMVSVHYTFALVIPTLAIVEDPDADSYALLDGDENGVDARDGKGVSKGQVGLDLQTGTKPITHSFRSTIRHLRARGGRLSRFRGFRAFFFWISMRRLTQNLVSRGLNSLGATISARILADILLTNLVLTWVHIVISEPSSKMWFRRIPSLRGNFLKALPAVALASVTSTFIASIPRVMQVDTGKLRVIATSILANPQQQRPLDFEVDVSRSAIAVVLSLVLFVLIDIPANVTMIRVAASLLPADVETIVPFDRTFNGKLSPKLDGDGSPAKLGLIDAWKTFPWSSRIRLLKMVAKVAAMTVAITFVFSALIFGELLVLMHSAGKKGFPDAVPCH